MGVGILINTLCNCKILEYQEIIVGRKQLKQLEIEGKPINIFNINAPNSDDINLFCTLETN